MIFIKVQRKYKQAGHDKIIQRRRHDAVTALCKGFKMRDVDPSRKSGDNIVEEILLERTQTKKQAADGTGWFYFACLRGI